MWGADDHAIGYEGGPHFTHPERRVSPDGQYLFTVVHMTVKDERVLGVIEETSYEYNGGEHGFFTVTWPDMDLRSMRH